MMEDMWDVSRGSVIGGGSCADVDVDTGGFSDGLAKEVLILAYQMSALTGWGNPLHDLVLVVLAYQQLNT